MVLTQLPIALLVLFFLGSLAYFFFLAAWEWSLFVQLRRLGKRQIADVISYRVEKGRANSYFIEYTYEVEGTKYSKEEQISAKTYKRIQREAVEDVDIAYLPQMPRFSRLTGNWEDESFRMLVTIFGSAVIWIEPRMVILWVMFFIGCNIYLRNFKT